MSEPKIERDPRELAPGAVRFLARVGLLLMAWNAVEHWMRLFVSRHTGNTWETFCATGERSKKDGPLKARMEKAATAFADAEARDAVLHFTEAFDRLREHRNRIVHRIRYAFEQQGVGRGMLMDADRVSISHEQISEQEVAALADECWTFDEFARQICVVFDDNGDRREPGSATPTKPSLPMRFADPRVTI
jgi:hypothetical protein